MLHNNANLHAFTVNVNCGFESVRKIQVEEIVHQTGHNQNWKHI